MLSEQSTNVVRETLPAIGGAINDITPRFYARMFDAHPELIRDVFNRGNQAQGEQPKALAASIAAYATMLVAPGGPPAPSTLERIAHKHASLGVVEDQYLIVHKHLFDAIVEVLGEAVTPEVAAAWDEVYWHMARDLIAAERSLYRGAGVSDGDVWRDLVVAERHEVGGDAASFVLADPDGAPLPGFTPGQYVSVQVPMADGARQIRQYSLSWSPRRDRWRIGVRRVPSLGGDPAGEVSSMLVDTLEEGQHLRTSLPFGDLRLADGDAPLVLVSAGIGCTPMMGILDHLAYGEAPGRRSVTIVHADATPARHPYREELPGLAEQIDGAALHTWYESLDGVPASSTTHEGWVDMGKVPVPLDADVYLCGPLPFMSLVHDQLVALGVSPLQIRYEVFGPDTWLPSA
ncbi:hemin transporter [Paraoerskovia sediminicola]|uniref:nitric oxide dioxygenase n=1 Tax=Paraoerskovia sediminicola TaxID=1138587 RepID=A0ABN6XEL6_9CELL|nr:globin domain-containing protein [Paraoerskovia sediminicola]BDZ43264.1 hemin transporter [Paraoerskovia sediminicola]